MSDAFADLVREVQVLKDQVRKTPKKEDPLLTAFIALVGRDKVGIRDLLSSSPEELPVFSRNPVPRPIGQQEFGSWFPVQETLRGSAVAAALGTQSGDEQLKFRKDFHVVVEEVEVVATVETLGDAMDPFQHQRKTGIDVQEWCGVRSFTSTAQQETSFVIAPEFCENEALPFGWSRSPGVFNAFMSPFIMFLRDVRAVAPKLEFGHSNDILVQWWKLGAQLRVFQYLDDILIAHQSKEVLEKVAVLLPKRDENVVNADPDQSTSLERPGVVGSFVGAPDDVGTGIWNRAEKRCHIFFLELRAVRRVLETFAKQLREKEIILKTDSMTMFWILQRQCSRTGPLLEEYRKLWVYMDLLRMTLQPVWLPSEENEIADAMSRRNPREEFAINPRVFHQIEMQFEQCTVDRFAAISNRKVERFNARNGDLYAEQIDAFAQEWRNEVNYVCPPLHLLERVVQFLHLPRNYGRLNVIVVVPAWRTRQWYWTPRAISSQVWVIPQVIDCPILIPDAWGGQLPYGWHNWTWEAIQIKPWLLQRP
ncbi:hypothetical protein BSKO_02696 [Bryopsis sp. KO-2023]|nr:hypothetical protein BSKO_02696 [Bryopsis sp. KO-2023]